MSKAKEKFLVWRLFNVWIFALAAVLSVVILISVVVWKFGLQIPGTQRNMAVVSLGEDSESSESAKLLVEFRLADEVQQQRFADLGLSNMEITIDRESGEQLGKILPVKLDLALEDGRLYFRSFGDNLLVSSDSKQKISYASRSAKFLMEYSGVDDASIEAYDVTYLMREATKTGNLYISKELISGLEVLSKLRNFKLVVSGDLIEGWMEF